MPDFSKRSFLPEKMDDPSVKRSDLEKALSELEAVNTWLGGYNVMYDALDKIDLKQNDKITDVGCGGGDVLRKISAFAKRKKIKVQLLGIDFNQQTVDYARSKSHKYPDIHFKAMDVRDMEKNNERTDILINNLFCHHFDDSELEDLLKIMYSISSRHVIINDLHRHWFAYYAIKFITVMFSGSYLVKYDGPLSVARALTRKEWKLILNKAGIKNYSIKWMWAWRWQIIISKN
jgi:ubiquinone/menaquinone biosynthesis C-methylase UbiE